MAKENQESQPKAQQKPKPASTQQQMGLGVGVGELASDSLGLATAPGVEKQANRLADSRLSVVQRQMMAANLGQLQGNGHLQQVMAFVRQNEASGQNDGYNEASQLGIPTSNGTDLLQRQEEIKGDASSEAEKEESESTERLPQVNDMKQSFAQKLEGELQLEPGYTDDSNRSDRGLPQPGEASVRTSNAVTQISGAKEELQAKIENKAQDESAILVKESVPHAESQDVVTAEQGAESVSAEVEAMRAPVQEASLPVEDISGVGAESQIAVDRLRSTQGIDPRLIDLADGVNERITSLRDRAAQNAERASGQIRSETEIQRNAIRGSMATSQLAVSSIMAGSRNRISESKTAAHENLSQHGESVHAQIAETITKETSRLQENLNSSVEEGRTIFREADEDVRSTGAEEAQRGRDYHSELARRARDMGQREAEYYRGSEDDEDLGEDKAEAVMDVAKRFAKQLDQDGDGLHSDVLEQAEEARTQITAEEEPTVQGLADVAPGAVESIQTYLGSVDEAAQQVVQQSAEQLGAAETGAHDEVANLERATDGRGKALIGQGEAQLDAVMVSGLLSQAKLAGQAGQTLDDTGRDAIQQIQQTSADNAEQNPDESTLVQRQMGPGDDSGASDGIEGQNEVLSVMDEMGPALDQAADTQTAELTQGLSETAAGSEQVGTAWVDETQGQMDSLNDVANSGMTDIANTAGDQLDSTFDQGANQAVSEVDRISQDVASNVDEVRVSVDGGVNEATDSLRQGVDDGNTHANEVIGELPAEMNEAARAQESFFGSIGHWFSEQLAQTWQAIQGMADWGFLLDLAVGIIVGVLVAVAVAALIGTGVGAILVAGALAGAAGFAAAQMSANVRNGDPLFNNVGHAAILGAFVGMGGAGASVLSLGLLAGTGLVMLGAGIGTVVANVSTRREWDDHLLANILILGVFHAVVKSAVDRLPSLRTKRVSTEEKTGEWPEPTGETPTVEIDTPSRIKATEPEARPDGGYEYTLYDVQTGAEFCSVEIAADAVGRPQGGPHLTLTPTRAVLPDGTLVNLRSKGFSWTPESLRVSMEAFRRKFGSPPENMDGLIAWKNLENFQKEYVRIRSENPSLSEGVVAEQAAKNISFGRHRIELGYGDISVQYGNFGDVRLPSGEVLQNVPRYVEIGARPNRPGTVVPAVPDTREDNNE